MKEEVTNLHTKHTLVTKPFVIITGPSIREIQTSHVVIGNHIYQVPSVAAAVDVCFQSIKIFNTGFSIVCNHVWQIISEKVYKFKETGMIPSAAKLIDTLDKA